jgi:hypothetical protein
VLGDDGSSTERDESPAADQAGGGGPVDSDAPVPAPSDKADAASALQRFRQEVRDGVTLRSAVLVLGVFALQMGFIASYVGAFHSPTPRRIPIAIVLPAGAPASLTNQTVDRLNALPHHPLRVRAASSEADARRLLARRDVSGALILNASGPDRMLVTSAGGGAVSQALDTIAGRIESAQRRTVTVHDVIPAAPGDARGLSGFYVVVGWAVGGYLVSSILGIAGGARPANRSRAVIRLLALATYAIVSGLGGALIAHSVYSALPSHFLRLWGLGALLVFAVGAFTMACQVLLGILGIGVAILLFVVLGNPSAGGAYPSALLPTFWAKIGPYLPPGAGTDAVRSIVYFSDAKIARDLVVLAVYAIVGVVVTDLFAGWRSEQAEPAAVNSAAVAASPR